MWPFSGSNVDVVAQKLRERSLALQSKSEENPADSHFLRATGEHDETLSLTLKFNPFDTAQEIVSHIEKGEWTASQVLEAYIARAAIAHERTNCLTECTLP